MTRKPNYSGIYQTAVSEIVDIVQPGDDLARFDRCLDAANLVGGYACRLISAAVSPWAAVRGAVWVAEMGANARSARAALTALA